MRRPGPTATRIGQVLGVLGIGLSLLSLQHRGSDDDAHRAAARAVDAVAAVIEGPSEPGEGLVDPAEVARQQGYDELSFTEEPAARGPDPFASAHTVSARDTAATFCLRIDYTYDPLAMHGDNHVVVSDGRCRPVDPDSPGSTDSNDEQEAPGLPDGVQP